MAIAAGLAGASVVEAASFVEQFDTLGTFSARGQDSGVAAPPGYAVTLPSGDWYAYNNSSAPGFVGIQGQTGGSYPFQANPGDGPKFATIPDNSANPFSGDGTADYYFETPVETLSNGDTLSFITIGSNNAVGRMNIKMSTAGSSSLPSDFTTTLLTINPSLAVSTNGAGYPTGWTLYTVTVSGLSAPMSGRFAFDYNVPNSNNVGNLVGFDRVTYTAVAAVPEPGALGLVGVAGVGLLRRRK